MVNLNPVIETICARQSTRAYQNKPVTHEQVLQILNAAARSASGTNIQPWQVKVVMGKKKRELSDGMIAAFRDGQKPREDYQYYPLEWRSPYKERRKECGLALYSALGIKKEDTERRKEVWEANYRFFDAPCGLLFFIDQDLEQGSWVDMGMFIGAVMIAAKGIGLDTCPQASIAEYPDIAREILGVSDDKKLICGMALGYGDKKNPINLYRLGREPADSFVEFFD